MRKNETVRLQVVIPFHQPLSHTHAQLAEACERCYMPLIAALEKYESVRVALHFGGHILDYLARSQEGFLLRVKNLVKRGQVEVLGGLFYGGIPALLPEFDVRSQIEMSTEFWESFVGVTPKGFWLTELAWAPELPRLLDETGLHYGFVGSSQVAAPSSAPLPALGSLQRGGHKMAAFVLDSGLSQALPARPAVEWMQAVRDIGAKNPSRVVTAWVRAESLGLEPGTHAWCHEQHWLTQWFTALTEGLQASTVLPQETFPSLHPTQPISLQHVCAPELQAFAADAPSLDWTDFPYQFSEVDTLFRRMLRASAKLREAIGVMEDEELEERWSDQLATAQRLVFSSQAPDVYYRGLTPGFADPALRDATMARLLRAENIMDDLVQGTEDYLAFEELDLDDDGVDEEFVATRRLSVWLDPKRGDIRTLENRIVENNVLDVGCRRSDVRLEEPAGKGAQRRAEANRQGVAQPEDLDILPRRGTREWLVEPETSAEALFGGKAKSFLSPNHTWDMLEHGVDEDGDCSYQLHLRTVVPLTGAPGGVENTHRKLICHKAIKVPIDASRLTLEYTWELQGGSPILWALELPVRLGALESRLFVEGKQVMPPQAASQGRAAYVEGTDGSVMLLEFSRPISLWCHPVRTVAKDLSGWANINQGLLLAPVVRIEGHASLKITLDLQRRADKV